MQPIQVPNFYCPKCGEQMKVTVEDNEERGGTVFIVECWDCCHGVYYHGDPHTGEIKLEQAWK